MENIIPEYQEQKDRIAKENGFLSYGDFVTSVMIKQVSIKKFEKVIDALIEDAVEQGEWFKENPPFGK